MTVEYNKPGFGCQQREKNSQFTLAMITNALHHTSFRQSGSPFLIAFVAFAGKRSWEVEQHERYPGNEKAALESQSEDPIAEGIVRSAEDKGLTYAAPREFQAIPGTGAQAIVNGMRIRRIACLRYSSVTPT